MIAQIFQSVGPILVMLLLLAFSAFFAGSETALFSLSTRHIQQWQASGRWRQKTAAYLRYRPEYVLNCLLFGNMIVNVLFYAVSSVLVQRMGRTWGFGAATAVAFATFLLLVLFGEILPKSVAYSHARALATAAAFPIFIVVTIFGPITAVFRVLFLEPVLRVLLGHARSPQTITLAEFRSLVNLSRRRGLITESENRLLGEVVDLGQLKVRHVMRPRVDLVSCKVSDPPATVRAQMCEHRLTKIPVYAGKLDNIIGLVHLRRLLLEPGARMEKLVEPVTFVPEQKTVESLLEFFRKSGTDLAIVVDEYGGIAGSVQLEDIAEELFGRLEPPAEVEPIKQLGPFQYRLAGHLALHDWAEVLGIDLEETRSSTLAGLVTNLLGKMPQEGDVACLGNLKFTVERVRKRRIETVILSVEPLPSHGP
ncbi:MAG: hemolysin family protein [Planctomycetes bacterium]|jgi:CBS domain containing-hemolysin-like protein|nr:hemolysin family protein [Planctomycetota bacterium]